MDYELVADATVEWDMFKHTKGINAFPISVEVDVKTFYAEGSEDDTSLDVETLQDICNELSLNFEKEFNLWKEV